VLISNALARRKEFFSTPYGRGQWISIWADTPFNWDFVRELVIRSYRLVAPKGMIAAPDAITPKALIRHFSFVSRCVAQVPCPGILLGRVRRWYGSDSSPPSGLSANRKLSNVAAAKQRSTTPSGTNKLRRLISSVSISPGFSRTGKGEAICRMEV